MILSFRHTGAHTFGTRRETWVKTSIELLGLEGAAKVTTKRTALKLLITSNNCTSIYTYIYICLIIFKQDYLSTLKCCLEIAVVQFQGPLGLEHLRRSLDFSQDAGLTDVRDFMSICNIYIYIIYINIVYIYINIIYINKYIIYNIYIHIYHIQYPYSW